MNAGKTIAMDAQEKKWRTEDDLRTLVTAAEIRKDPKRMAACKAMAKEKMSAMHSVAEKK